MQKSMEKVMDMYRTLMNNLKKAYQPILTTKEHFTRSIRANEDGFFLRLYKIIAECKIIMCHHLGKFFFRERSWQISNRGGYF